jgi:hypothetical protein
MGMFKEEISEFEDIAEHAYCVQYKGELHYGWYLNSDDGKIYVPRLKAAMNEIADLEEKTVVKDGVWARTYFIAFEQDDGIYRGSEITVSYLTYFGKKFVSLMIKNRSRTTLNYKVA